MFPHRLFYIDVTNIIYFNLKAIVIPSEKLSVRTETCLMESTAKLLGLIVFHRLCQALSHTEYSLGPRMTRSANVRESSSRTVGEDGG